MEKVEEILKQYPCFGEDIKDAQSKLNMYIMLQKEARNPLKAQTISDEPHGIGISDQTYNAVEKLIDRYQVEIDQCISVINNTLDTKKWLDKALTELTDTERRVIYMRYDKGININKMPYYLHCGRNTIYKILDDAKAKIRRIL